jgi:hypothetical protein
MNSVVALFLVIVLFIMNIESNLTENKPKCPEGYEYDEVDNQCYVCPEGFVRGEGHNCVSAYTEDL